MTIARPTTIAVLLGALALTASACGGGSKHASTSTTSTANPSGGTASGGKPKRTPLSATPAKTLTFSGTGVKELGVVRLPVNSTLEWTDDAPAAVRLFQIIPASVKVQSPVNSREASGRAQIKKGAYHGFLVNADGKWTLKIVPGGG